MPIPLIVLGMHPPEKLEYLIVLKSRGFAIEPKIVDGSGGGIIHVWSIESPNLPQENTFYINLNIIKGKNDVRTGFYNISLLLQQALGIAKDSKVIFSFYFEKLVDKNPDFFSNFRKQFKKLGRAKENNFFAIFNVTDECTVKMCPADLQGLEEKQKETFSMALNADGYMCGTVLKVKCDRNRTKTKEKRAPMLVTFMQALGTVPSSSEPDNVTSKFIFIDAFTTHYESLMQKRKKRGGRSRSASLCSTATIVSSRSDGDRVAEQLTEETESITVKAKEIEEQQVMQEALAAEAEKQRQLANSKKIKAKWISTARQALSKNRVAQQRWHSALQKIIKKRKLIFASWHDSVDHAFRIHKEQTEEKLRKEQAKEDFNKNFGKKLIDDIKKPWLDGASQDRDFDNLSLELSHSTIDRGATLYKYDKNNSKHLAGLCDAFDWLMGLLSKDDEARDICKEQDFSRSLLAKYGRTKTWQKYMHFLKQYMLDHNVVKNKPGEYIELYERAMKCIDTHTGRLHKVSTFFRCYTSSRKKLISEQQEMKISHTASTITTSII